MKKEKFYLNLEKSDVIQLLGYVDTIEKLNINEFIKPPYASQKLKRHKDIKRQLENCLLLNQELHKTNGEKCWCNPRIEKVFRRVHT